MIKVIGAVCVIAGGTAIGFSAANVLRERLQLYRAFLLALETIRSELSFRGLELHRIFKKTAQDAPWPLDALFSFLSDSLQSEPGKPLSEHLRAALEAIPAPLPPPIVNSMQTLSATLGGEDAENQIKTIEICLSRMTSETKALENQMHDRCRCRRLIGICGGTALAILLL